MTNVPSKETPENELFFITPEFEPELNAAQAVDPDEQALYTDDAEPASEYERNTTVWD